MREREKVAHSMSIQYNEREGEPPLNRIPQRNKVYYRASSKFYVAFEQSFFNRDSTNFSGDEQPPLNQDSALFFGALVLFIRHFIIQQQTMSFEGGSKDFSEGSSSTSSPQPGGPIPSRYESQKRRDWNTFCQYLKNQRPPVPLSHCSCNHVLEFLRYLDQFGKTKVHVQGCMFYGQPEPPAPCTCPLRQAWGSLDALIGRLRAAYEESGGSPETNPFASGAIRVYLRDVRECQAKARGIPYKKKKKTTTTNQSKGAEDSTSMMHFVP